MTEVCNGTCRLLCDVYDLLQEQGLVAKDKEDGEEEEGQKEGGEEGEGGEALPLVHFPPNLRVLSSLVSYAIATRCPGLSL